MNQVREVSRASAMNGVEAHACDLVANTCFYRKPVQSAEVWSDVVSTWDSQDQAGCSVLESLDS